MLNVESLYMLHRTVDEYTLQTPYILQGQSTNFFHAPAGPWTAALPGTILLDDEIIGNNRSICNGQPTLCAGYSTAGGIGVVVAALQGNRDVAVGR